MIIVYPVICTYCCNEGLDTVALCVRELGGCNLIQLMANLEGRRFPLSDICFEP